MHRRSTFYSRGFLVAAVLAALALTAAPIASAQDPAAVSQYVAQQPTVGGEAGGAGETQEVVGSQGGGGTSAGDVAQEGGSGGSLPFTGYPLSSFAWIVIGFVLAGLCLRFASFAYRRWSGPEPQSP